jgi:multidrug resistance efflux pump
MSQVILPKEVIELIAESHLATQSRTNQIIYLIIIAWLLASIGLLPFLMVSISINSQGLLKATTEISVLKAPSNGIVQDIFIKENQGVSKGEVLVSVHSPLLQEKKKFLSDKAEEFNRLFRDVKQLANNYVSIANSKTLSTSLYRQSWNDYQQRMLDKEGRLMKVTQDYDRNKKLFDQKVIAAADFENFQFEFDRAKSDIELLRQNQLSHWQQELRNYQKEMMDLKTQLAQVSKEIENLNIKAPVSGTVQNLAGIYSGSTVFAGQELAQISPNTPLQAEIYVSPNDIGLLREGMDVRMQVGAFNYNQWGLLHGKVKEISNDIQIVNNQPLFEVKCSLDKDHLSLKNGYQGKLKKGMTLQARFLVTERSLWQLLYDKVDDWVNPNIKSQAAAK